MAAASLAATFIAVAPGRFTSVADGAGSPGATADLALATGHGLRPRVGQLGAAGLQGANGQQSAADRAQPENPALAARQALNVRYAESVQAAKVKAAARRAAIQAARQRQQAAERRREMSGTPQQIAMAMLPSFGWTSSEFSCLNLLWDRESGWNPSAANPSSGAYGIPQALPGSKMATAGADWATDPATQIRWGLGYIRASYGSPCGAWAHETTSGWY